MTAALAAARTSGSREQALREHDNDVYALSSVAPRLSCWTTWCRFHRTWFTDEPVLPLTRDKVRVIASMFKQGGYRSFGNYLAVAKSQHINMGYPWSDEISCQANKSSSSTKRGLGPAKQSEALDLRELAKLPSTLGTRIPGGPIGPRNVMIAGSMFLLREVELSNALVKGINVNLVLETVTWHLPVSKPDPTALGAKVSWGCTCGSGDRICAYHAIREQLEFIRGKFREPHDDLPLFPSLDGRFVDEAAMTETVRYFATQLGEELTNPDGSQRFTGHAFRVSGARTLSALGIELYKIEILARWRSPMVLHYAQQAPLDSITKDLNSALQKSTMAEVLQGLKDKVGEIVTHLEHVDTATVKNLDEASAIRDRVAFLEQANLPGGYVINLKSCVIHRVMRGPGDKVAPIYWATPCGWEFGLAPHELLTNEPGGEPKWCRICCPGRVAGRRSARTAGQAGALPGAAGCSSASSSSSSSSETEAVQGDSRANIAASSDAAVASSEQ